MRDPNLDRLIAAAEALRPLIKQGMHLIVQVQQAQKRTEANLQRLEANVQTLVYSLRRQRARQTMQLYW